MLKNEITVGDILTAVSILVSVVALLVAWSREQQMKRKEKADHIRNAIGMVIAKLERRKDLAIQLFKHIQPLTVDADVMLTNEKNTVNARDFLWRNINEIRSRILGEIMDEEIEIAYKDLYGYDPRIHDLYSEAIRLLGWLDERVLKHVLETMQDNVLKFDKDAILHGNKKFESSRLGNMLRVSWAESERLYDILAGRIVEPFRMQMTELLKASDRQILTKKIQLQAVSNIFPTLESLESDWAQNVSAHTSFDALSMYRCNFCYIDVPTSKLREHLIEVHSLNPKNEGSK